MAQPNVEVIRLREGWLEAACGLLHEHMRGCGVPTAESCRISCGFPLARPGLAADQVAGQCFPPTLSRDHRPQIYISPLEDDSLAVMGTLMHELIHAGIGCSHGHGKAFSQAAKKVGLEKPWRSTRVSATLRPVLASYVAVLGPYPHAALLRLPRTQSEGKEESGKAQSGGSSSRLRLFQCECIPVIKARVAHDEFRATCEVCHALFHRVR